MERIDFEIPTLGEAKLSSPIKLSKVKGDYISDYVGEQYILYDIATTCCSGVRKFERGELLEKAGPREKIFFEPEGVHAAVVTCGGLCPGLNDVIRAIVMCLWYGYGVRRISGIRYGYRGFMEEWGMSPVELNPDVVDDIHARGGTILGSGRGYGDRAGEIVDFLEKAGINILFTIGGDGTHKAALGICDEIRKRGKNIAVVGVPKTIDNDLSFIERSFGFDTAVSEAVVAVAGAHVEAWGSVNGVGIVKVMGRQSGFIAAVTALAMNDVNFVLVPEVPFDINGKNGLLSHLERRLARRRHAVILVAEGAGQEYVTKVTEKDEWGIVRLGDIGTYLRDVIKEHFKRKGIEVNVKYIDPSYMIRSAPANANDAVYCMRLGTYAVHAGMGGRTEMLVGLMHNEFVHIPMRTAVCRKNNIDPEGSLWRDVIEATGQPALMKNK